MEHLTAFQLQEYADGFIDAASSGDIEIHLRSCADCHSRLDNLRQLEKALRSIPLDQVSPNFTHRVMRRLGIGELSSLSWSVVKNLAPFFALLLVITALVLVMNLYGGFRESSLGQSVEASQSIYRSAGGSISMGLRAFNEWIGKYFAFGKIELAVFLAVFLGAIGLIDKLILMPMIRRRV